MFAPCRDVGLHPARRALAAEAPDVAVVSRHKHHCGEVEAANVQVRLHLATRIEAQHAQCCPMVCGPARSLPVLPEIVRAEDIPVRKLQWRMEWFLAGHLGGGRRTHLGNFIHQFGGALGGRVPLLEN